MEWRRFVVVEESMQPTLRPGDRLLAVRDPDPPAGSVVTVPHPGREGMWLVKRAAAVSTGDAWLSSDAPEATLADSRTLGWVSTESMYRVVLRLRPPLSIRRLRPRPPADS